MSGSDVANSVLAHSDGVDGFVIERNLPYRIPIEIVAWIQILPSGFNFTMLPPIYPHPFMSESRALVCVGHKR